MKIDFALPLPACVDCGTRLCLRCVRRWAEDDNTDTPLCKKDWRARQVVSSRRGDPGVDKESDT